MTGYELELAIASIAIRAIAAIAAVGSLVAILGGLRQMKWSTEERARREDQRHAESMEIIRANHADNMEGFRVLIQGMDQQAEISRAVVKGMEQQGEALRVVIERTAPRQ